MNHPLYLGVIAAVTGCLMMLRSALRSQRCTPRPLSPQTSAMLDSNSPREAAEALFGKGLKLPWSDLLSLYWNSRDLLRRAHNVCLKHPEDVVLAAMFELEEDAHARTRRNLRMHIHERLGIGGMENASQVYSLFLLDSYGEELTVIEQMTEHRVSLFRGAF